MKAEVQYNDFVGTTAADISDFQSLEDYLRSKNVDVERYTPVGVRFDSSYSKCGFEFICIDNENPEGKRVIIGFEEELTLKEFFNLFKRLEIVLVERYSKDFKVDEDPIMIDNR